MEFKNIPLSKPDFDACKWEEVIDQCPKKECFSYSDLFFVKAKEADANGDSKTYELFTLLAAVTAFSLRSDSNDDPYGPTERVLEDVLESHLEALGDIASTVKDAEMRARIADLLWVKKHDFRKAELAIEAYLESAKILEDPDNWLACADRIERATRIAVSIGPSNKAFTQVFSYIESVLDKYNGEDPLFLSSRMMELLLEFSQGDPIKYAALAEKAATRSEAEANWHKARTYWEIKARWHEKEKNADSKREALVKAAECYVKEAEFSLTKQNPSYLAAVIHLRKAIEAHRRIGGTKARVEELHKVLLEYEAESVKELKPISTSLNASAKVREEIEKSVATVKGKDFQDALFELALMLRLPKVDDLRIQARKSASEHPLQHLITAMAIDRQGKVVGKRPSMLSENEEDVDAALRGEMFFHAGISENIDVNWTLLPVIRQIVIEHPCRLNDILPIVSNNPLVPEGREMLYAKGLQAGIRSDLDIAAHFLIPQFEHSIRYILAQRGVITSSIDQDGIQQEYDLNKTLYMSEVKDAFGTDVVFHLQRLLVEPLGGNLRNKMAHGLMSSEEFFSIPVAYLWWLILKLLCLPIIAYQREKASQSAESSESLAEKSE
jgi:hypothetical protein